MTLFTKKTIGIKDSSRQKRVSTQRRKKLLMASVFPLNIFLHSNKDKKNVAVLHLIDSF